MEFFAQAFTKPLNQNFMKKLIFTLTIAFAVTCAYAQTSYTKLITTKRDISFPSITKALNGSFFISYNMYIKSTNENILAVSFFDKTGNQKWSRHFKDSSNYYEWAAQTVQPNSTGFITASTISSGYGKGKLSVFKSDTKGNILWNKTISINGKMVESVRDVEVAADGNILIAGTIRPIDYLPGDGDACILKVNGINGNVFWAKTLEIHKTTAQSHFARGKSLAITKDSGFVLGSNSYNADQDYNPVIAKYDKQGNLQWAKMITPLNNNLYEDELGDVVQTLDGGYALTGTALDSAGTRRAFVMRTNSNGNPIWAIATDFGESSGASSIVINDDSSFTICGTTTSSYRPVLSKINKSGNVVWSTKLTYNTSFSSNVIKTYDKGYITISPYYNTSRVSILLPKFDNNGNTCSDNTASVPLVKNLPYEIFPSVIDSSDITSQLYIESGHVLPTSAGAANDSLLCSSAVAKQNLVENIFIKTMDNKLQVKIYPNPAINNTLHLTINTEKTTPLVLSIYNSEGKIVHTERMYNTGKQVAKSINVGSFAAGVYFIKMQNGKEQTTLSFVKQ